jgi:multidrug efflux pump subunit AcrB
MLKSLITYFARRHLLVNLIALIVFLGGAISWQSTSKEEMPDITFDSIRISVRYPGAPSEDVEYLVTKPIEEAVRGLDGVYRVESTSSVSESNITVELEPHYPDKDEAMTEIRNAVLDVDLPSEVLDDPVIRIFKTSKKAILDVALIDKNSHLINTESRRKLQEIALTLENQLINLKSVNSVNRKGYLQPEIQIRAIPQKLLEYRIPFNTVMNEVQRNHIRKPAGNIEAPSEPKVTLLSELDTVEKLSGVIVQGGFEGQVVRLNQVAEIESSFEKATAILKVNGHEAIMLEVVKNSSYGILEALDQVTEAIEKFKKINLEGSNVELVALDDESIDIRNRLALVSMNGIIGFILILLTLFIFLNKRSGIWVAFGIPFTLCFTMIAGKFMGFTINGTTLAARDYCDGYCC